ncbi:MAG: zinc ribbon domain-containing protein [Deltaproteobacteria bacterium]|nr:zinc ribbon domain-containing protein [Deltaproteobacteria bacterium]
MGPNWFGAGLGPALVLQKFHYDSEAGTVCVKGRMPGIKAFVLSAMGLDATTSFDVEPKQISYRSASLSGEDHLTVPTPCIATLSCGFNKPLGYLVAAVVALIGGVYAGMTIRELGSKAMLAGLLGAVLFLVGYFLSKKIYISVITNGGNIIGIRFKRSVIENIAVDIDKVKDIIALMRKNVVMSHGFVLPGTPPAAEVPAGKACTKCGARLANNDMFCGECGTRL